MIPFMRKLQINYLILHNQENLIIIQSLESFQPQKELLGIIKKRLINYAYITSYLKSASDSLDLADSIRIYYMLLIIQKTLNKNSLRVI
jgi:hypothetical protein